MSDDRSLNQGDIAPDFEFKDATGNTLKLSSILFAKDVVLYFYPKSFTPGCTLQAKEFSRDYDIFKQKNIELVGVSPDDDSVQSKFKQQNGIPYLLVSDVSNDISKLYGVYGMKSFMGKNYLGVNRSTFLIQKGGRIFKIYRKVKPAGHSKEVLADFS